MSGENTAKYKKRPFEKNPKNKKTALKSKLVKKYLDKLYLYCYNDLVRRCVVVTAKEIVKHIMYEKDISNADMAAALDISQAALWDRLNSAKTNNMTVKKLNSMLKYLGYEVVVLPRGRAGRLEGSFVVSDSETSKSPYDLAELLKED